MEAGEIEAILIQKDSTEGTVMLKNKTGKPLTVKMEPPKDMIAALERMKT